MDTMDIADNKQIPLSDQNFKPAPFNQQYVPFGILDLSLKGVSLITEPFNVLFFLMK
jgi:hypothetical protein